MTESTFLSGLSLNTVARKRNLVSDLAEAISREIAEGRLQAGDRLPTEAELAAAAGVSRTVVREAVAALKAAKLVQTRQGAGAFVLPPPPKSDFFASLSSGEVDDILAMLELRLAVEVEAASLAAVRRTDEEMAALDRALENIVRGEDYGIAADLEFHRILAGRDQESVFRALPELPRRVRGPARSHRAPGGRGSRASGLSRRDRARAPGDPRRHRHERLEPLCGDDARPSRQQPQPLLGAHHAEFREACAQDAQVALRRESLTADRGRQAPIRT